jgi:hypothetical protein
MTRVQLAVAGITGMLLIALLTWQHHREQMVKACIDAGGYWHGPDSACLPEPLRPILRRDLQRS